MRQFFNPDNFLWRWASRLADFVLLSCCWTLCCIPVVTIGASSIALYDTVARCVRGYEGNMFRRFFRTFKNELGRGVLITVFWAAIAFVLNVGYQVLAQMGQESSGWAIFSLIYFVSLLLPVGCACWVIATESRFVHSFGTLHRNAFIFTFAHLPHTAAVALLFVVALNVLINIPPLIMFIPGLMVYLQSFFIEKVLKKYMPPEQEE